MPHLKSSNTRTGETFVWAWVRIGSHVEMTSHPPYVWMRWPSSWYVNDGLLPRERLCYETRRENRQHTFTSLLFIIALKNAVDILRGTAHKTTRFMGIAGPFVAMAEIHDIMVYHANICSNIYHTQWYYMVNHAIIANNCFLSAVALSSAKWQWADYVTSMK